MLFVLELVYGFLVSNEEPSSSEAELEGEEGPLRKEEGL